MKILTMKKISFIIIAILFIYTIAYAGRDIKSIKEKVKTYPISVEAGDGPLGGTMKASLGRYSVRIIKCKKGNGSCVPSQNIL
jgi:hypothetical protein